MSAVDLAVGKFTSEMRTSGSDGTKVSPSLMGGADASESEGSDCSHGDDDHKICCNIRTSTFGFNYRLHHIMCEA